MPEATIRKYFTDKGTIYYNNYGYGVQERKGKKKKIPKGYYISENLLGGYDILLDDNHCLDSLTKKDFENEAKDENFNEIGGRFVFFRTIEDKFKIGVSSKIVKAEPAFKITAKELDLEKGLDILDDTNFEKD